MAGSISSQNPIFRSSSITSGPPRSVSASHMPVSQVSNSKSDKFKCPQLPSLCYQVVEVIGATVGGTIKGAGTAVVTIALVDSVQERNIVVPYWMLGQNIREAGSDASALRDLLKCCAMVGFGIAGGIWEGYCHYDQLNLQKSKIKIIEGIKSDYKTLQESRGARAKLDATIRQYFRKEIPHGKVQHLDRLSIETLIGLQSKVEEIAREYRPGLSKKDNDSDVEIQPTASQAVSEPFGDERQHV